VTTFKRITPPRPLPFVVPCYNETKSSLSEIGKSALTAVLEGDIV